ncbi:Alpha,alpha-trehalose-phosphate synthase UDP-forming [Musa troglodytarum]|uniref:Alpha,alpha-trehalose-phosphate synthase UDP-forming n=2 Tax=Musa troglodytarum TaxID=320322 RepID=A0A9E7I854_9LILI|nr:Alpha,alpha-trehalose-phosphate synthase UDP-forming [Musa troglodytarum]
MGNDQSRAAPSLMAAMAKLGEQERRFDTATDSESSSVQGPQVRLIMVMNQLPVRATKDPSVPGGWIFNEDEDSPIAHLAESSPASAELVLVGTIPCATDLPQKLSNDLTTDGLRLHNFLFFPVFVPPQTESIVSCVCNKYFNRALHSVLPFTIDEPCYDHDTTTAWFQATALFADAVARTLTSGEDLVWVQDYHLFLLPSFLRWRHPFIRLGFSLHAPFPTPDFFLPLPLAVRILQSLLCCDLLGFHALDQARHFLACCHRALGLRQCTRRSPSPDGFLGINHLGRTIGIHVLFPGMARFQMSNFYSAAQSTPVQEDLSRLRDRFCGNVVLLGMDDLDVFNSINLKLLAVERLLQRHAHYRGRIVLVQVITGMNPEDERSTLLHQDIRATCARINSKFGSDLYKPIVLKRRAVSSEVKAAHYMLADCLVITAMRCGVNLIPYEYVVSRQADPSTPSAPKKSRLVLSEFMGCSQALSRAATVNPLNIDDTAETLAKAIDMNEEEQQEQHEKHHTYIKSHDVAYWSRSFTEDLRSCSEDRLNNSVRMDGSIVTVSKENFTELQKQRVTTAYLNTATRVLLLDYDGTLESVLDTPKTWVIETLNALCAMPENTVFIVSGRTKKDLQAYFGACRGLGIAAEHGYYIRWPGQNEWITTDDGDDLEWVRVARPVMKWYTQATKHSRMEIKDSALVWQCRHSDSIYASEQTKEMADHLKELLMNEPVAVKTGHRSVEVHPKGVNKGSSAKKILSAMADHQQRADFVLCVGDDSSDEEMFELFASKKHKDVVASRATVFTCKVARKPSRARYYLENAEGVKGLLVALKNAVGSEFHRAHGRYLP